MSRMPRSSTNMCWQLVPKIKKLIIKKIIPLPEKQKEILSSFPNYLQNGRYGHCFTKKNDREALYAHIIWEVELFLVGKPHLGHPQQVLLHGVVPSWGAGLCTCPCWASWVVSPSLFNPPACQPASCHSKWCGWSHTPSTISGKQCPHLTSQNLIDKLTWFPPACIKIVVNPTHSEKVLWSGWWLNSREYKLFFFCWGGEWDWEFWNMGVTRRIS